MTDTAEQDAPILATRPLSDAAMEQVPYWNPGIPPWEPVKEPNSSLRIAAIVSDRLYEGLRFEGEVFLLTPDNARHTLDYGAPDLLIVESTWETATGHWYLAQPAPGAEADALRELVAHARSRGIPTVYWFTEDHVYHEHYREFATHFDHVFCADPEETQCLRAEGIQAEDLPPCVQPALYNPFRKHEEYDAMDLGVLFDGWGDLDRNPDHYAVLEEVREEHRLSILESRYLLTNNRLKAEEKHQGCILGCATRESRILALKYAKATISFEKTLSTPTTQRWEALQATASYCPAIHFGTFPEGDIRHGLVQCFGEDLDALVELIRMEEDDLYRQRIAHRAWRATLQNHTFSHRIRQICQTLGIAHDWDEYPKASVITPTCRPDMVPQAIETYRTQSYPNRELILVYNGVQPEELPEECEAPDIRVAHVPGDRFAGAALNLGAQLASGACCFRMDDDDIYGENYLLDMMLWLRCADATVWGKGPAPLKFEEAPEVYVRPGSRQPFQIVSPEVLHAGQFWLCGNSIAYRRTHPEASGYRDAALGAADTFFNREAASNAIVLVLDPFNDVAVRQSDSGGHTWRINPQDLKRAADCYPGVEDLQV
ncbi:glycosyltransferase [Thioalkalivibrio sp. AKL17]|uniref:glycosyltransferase n=1 Tax=Thioalkalivibrio sp. AKL17 TaxID=1158160 RepID=UPI000376379B|nr:glycosyltransferase [Thioalkalivibrio sp. AKL17]